MALVISLIYTSIFLCLLLILGVLVLVKAGKKIIIYFRTRKWMYIKEWFTGRFSRCQVGWTHRGLWAGGQKDERTFHSSLEERKASFPGIQRLLKNGWWNGRSVSMDWFFPIVMKSDLFKPIRMSSHDNSKIKIICAFNRAFVLSPLFVNHGGVWLKITYTHTFLFCLFFTIILLSVILSSFYILHKCVCEIKRQSKDGW